MNKIDQETLSKLTNLIHQHSLISLELTKAVIGLNNEIFSHTVQSMCHTGKIFCIELEKIIDDELRGKH